MKADIITIGDEILIGQITDTNSQWIAEQINNIGFKIRRITTVGDDKNEIINVLDNIIGKVNLIIITGGLGPTEDDITKQTLAEYFNQKLKENTEVLEDVTEFITSKGFELNKLNRKQAEVPENCKILRNKNGTAPGMWFKKNKTIIISLPAVPFEMKELVEKKVIPELKIELKLPNVIHKTVLTYGIPEASLAEVLSEWEQNLDKRISLAYLPSPERIRLRLSTICKNKNIAEEIINTEIEKVKNILGKNIFGYGDMFLQEAIGSLLIKKDKTLSISESCTAGNVSRLIASVPGSSKYFKGGIVAYSNEIKNKQLNVPFEIIEKYGAVSKEVVEAMAKGQRQIFKTDFSIAISGIAGPGGGTKEKPVGTTWIAVSDKNKTIARKFNFGKRRLLNVRFASSKSLDMLRKFISAYYD